VSPLRWMRVGRRIVRGRLDKEDGYLRGLIILELLQPIIAYVCR